MSKSPEPNRVARRQLRDFAPLLLAGVGLLSLNAAISAQVPQAAELDVDRLFTQARPHLEQALGQRLEPLGNVRVATTRELPAADPLIAAQVRWQFPDLRGEALTKAVAATQTAFQSVTIASLRPEAHALLVVTENARTMSQWHESLAAAQSASFVQLALVAEVIRAILEHRYALAQRFANCHDAEEFQALHAVVDGRSLWLTRQVARQLGTEAVFPLLAERYLRVPDTLSDPALRTVSQEALRRHHATITQGLAFFDYLEQHGGRDAEKLVFSHPPRQMAWVTEPALYWRAQQGQRADLAETMARLEMTLPASEWSAQQQPWTPAMILQAANLLGQKQRAEKIVRGWDDGRSLTWTAKRGRGQQVTLGVVRFQDAANARSYYGFALELQRKQDEMLAACATSRRTLDFHTETVRLHHADEAVKSDRQFQFASDSKPVAVSQLWVRAGDRVLEFTWTVMPADTAWAGSVLDVLLPDTKKD